MSEKSRTYDVAISACESPIEEMFLSASVQAQHPMLPPMVLASAEQLAREEDWYPFIFSQLDRFLLVVPQARLTIAGEQYRVDFLLLLKVSDHPCFTEIVIECDGHDYHERTKGQAKRDRRRDRRLAADGYLVLRFTGSELFRDAAECINEIVEFIDWKTFDAREWKRSEGVPCA